MLDDLSSSQATSRSSQMYTGFTVPPERHLWLELLITLQFKTKSKYHQLEVPPWQVFLHEVLTAELLQPLGLLCTPGSVNLWKLVSVLCNVLYPIAYRRLNNECKMFCIAKLIPAKASPCEFWEMSPFPICNNVNYRSAVMTTWSLLQRKTRLLSEPSNKNSVFIYIGLTPSISKLFLEATSPLCLLEVIRRQEPI